ncbi:MAG: MmgE/PrpD family protein [Candidatus Bipolaricaulota bacterium]|nr:MmgE/PrpD family protein [Candidatus Bipolaricaulota bacterium]
MNAIDYLVSFLRDLDWNDLPDEVRRKTKTCLLDALGATIAGSDSRSGEIVSDFAMETWGRGDATVIMKGRTAPIGAALANGYMANALDIDDGGKYTRGHPGAQIIPTVLALGESQSSSGKEVLAAIAAGYETAHRVGKCWHERFDEYRSCGSWGSVACAAASANLIGLKGEEIRNALGIADYNSPYLPMMRAVENPSMVKHGTGWGAMTGIIAAEWAEKGFTASGTSFETKTCNSLFEDLGSHYVMAEADGIEFKEIPSCSWSHPPIKAALGLLDAHDITEDEIERVEVRGFSEMTALPGGVPSSEEEAQFNVKWPLAVALVDGRVSVGSMSRERFDDSELRAMTERIEIVKSEKMEKMNRSLSREAGETSAWPTEVTIETVDGRTFESGTVTSEPSRVASMDRIADKFDRIVDSFLEKKEKRKVSELVKEFETVTRISDFTYILAGESSHPEVIG